MKSNLTFPFYAKATLVILGLSVLFFILFVGKGIIVPLIFSGIIAITLNPLVNFFLRKKINRALAIIFSLVPVFLILILVVLLLFSQFDEFAAAFPKLLDKFYELLNNAISWCSQFFNISTDKINGYIENTQTEMLKNSKAAIGLTVSSLLNGLMVMVLIPVYVFMILYYQPLLVDFIRKVFGKENLKEVNEILTLIKSIIQHYFLGLLIEAAIIATLNSVGLLIIGIKYAIVLGVFGAILNIIPYLGGLIAIGLYIIIALVTNNSISSVVYILILYTIIQFVDNNLIVPKIVGSKVKINALVAIVAVIAGGALWGVSGMFLSLPLIAIIKVIFDHIDNLKPWGFLLGDDMPKAIHLKK